MGQQALKTSAVSTVASGGSSQHDSQSKRELEPCGSNYISPIKWVHLLSAGAVFLSIHFCQISAIRF